MAWTLVCVVSVIALRLAADLGFEFPNVMNPANAPRAGSAVLCVIYLATGFVVLLYEKRNSRLRETLASERARFAYLADYDPLTGLSNRRRYTHELDRTFRRATRTKQGIALISVDLDNFEPVNDELGHMTRRSLPPRRHDAQRTLERRRPGDVRRQAQAQSRRLERNAKVPQDPSPTPDRSRSYR
jgi:predicted signal transduction protein with EAL and GGDEF domain